MKKFVFVFMLLPLFVAAQNAATVSVRFTKAASDSCSIKVQRYYIDEFEPIYQGIIKENQCDFSIPLEHPMFVKFNYMHQTVTLYLEAGTNLQLTIGTDSLYKSITYGENTSLENLFLKDFYTEFHADFDKKTIKQRILNISVDKFEISLYNAHKKQLNYYNAYKEKDKLSAQFKTFIENNIRYAYFASLLSYPIIYANQSAQILTVKPLPELMLTDIDAKLSKDEALESDAYRDFLYYYVVYFTSKTNGFNKFKDFNVSMESKIQTAIQNLTKASLMWYMADFLSSDCNKVSPYTVKHIYGLLKEREGDGVYTKLLKKKCETRIAMKEVAEKSVTNPQPIGGQSVSSASEYPKLKDLDGKTFAMDDFKGKVVYIDFWASWCGPCRREMPYSKQLHEMFSPKQLKNLVFLYISIDATEDAWKAAVKEIGMEGKLGISPGNWNSEIARFFQINSIPRYMLMDKTGKIVVFEANRPSSGEIIYNDIVKLLEE